MSNSTDTFAPEVEKHYGRFGRLYHGLTTIDFVGRRKIWFTRLARHHPARTRIARHSWI